MARPTELQSAESGKPAGDSAGGVAAGIAAVAQYAELSPLHRGSSLQGGAGALDLMVYEPSERTPLTGQAVADAFELPDGVLTVQHGNGQLGQLLVGRPAPNGLAATVLSRDLDHVQAAIDRLPVGTVKVNAVFGGAPGGAAPPRQGSGLGFGYGPELLDELTQVKVIHLQPAPAQAQAQADVAGTQ